MPDIGFLKLVIEGGALVVLAYAVYRLFGELSDQRKAAENERKVAQETMSHLCDRWDGWEKVRHDDSEKLNSTMSAMRENCAAVLNSQEGK